MSSVAPVPITHHLEGDDAFSAIRNAGLRHLFERAIVRFRYADGFSHARALAFQLVLAVIPALITVVALARLLDQQTVTEVRAVEGVGSESGSRVLSHQNDPTMNRRAVAREGGASATGSDHPWRGFSRSRRTNRLLVDQPPLCAFANVRPPEALGIEYRAYRTPALAA